MACCNLCALLPLDQQSCHDDTIQYRAAKAASTTIRPVPESTVPAPLLGAGGVKVEEVTTVVEVPWVVEEVTEVVI